MLFCRSKRQLRIKANAIENLNIGNKSSASSSQKSVYVGIARNIFRYSDKNFAEIFPVSNGMLPVEIAKLVLCSL